MAQPRFEAPGYLRVYVKTYWGSILNVDAYLNGYTTATMREVSSFN